ncbi:basic leucine zipper 43-like [Panicum miliaceum]|uniref:Basic leucine zipper 43-like n=1 Tax=Panicum miliaceum TaxID=4540 RepID=A0A3L6QG24_PANMI|nr:basic leucine zipper 43-like [Panicum miliaceum]
MVGPYNCNGNTTISSMSAGTADNQDRRSNDERKKRRLASNRESARRSRVRKQRRLDDLSSQVAELLDTNQRLLIELNHMIAKHSRVVRENAKLREEAADLQKRLNEMEVEEAEAAPGTPEVA